MSLFLTFEGGDGCGKSLQSKLLVDWLLSLGKKVVLTREPGGTHLAENIRSLLLIDEVNSLEPITEAMLFLAARSDHWLKVIKPAIENNSIVVCDRFQDSSVVYQGFGKNVSLDLLEHCYLEITNGYHPDRTYLLDLDPALGVHRSISRINNNETRFENMELSFHEKVRNSFLEIANLHSDRFLVLDGLLSSEKIHEMIKEDLMRQFHNIFE
jgi:dTMP kinase